MIKDYYIISTEKNSQPITCNWLHIGRAKCIILVAGVVHIRYIHVCIHLHVQCNQKRFS